jgi:hypothetical protein
MSPLSLVLWSISKPEGISGVGAQLHVGDGQVATVGNGGGFVEKSLGDAKSVFLAIALESMAAGENKTVLDV